MLWSIIVPNSHRLLLIFASSSPGKTLHHITVCLFKFPHSSWENFEICIVGDTFGGEAGEAKAIPAFHREIAAGMCWESWIWCSPEGVFIFPPLSFESSRVNEKERIKSSESGLSCLWFRLCWSFICLEISSITSCLVLELVVNSQSINIWWKSQVHNSQFVSLPWMEQKNLKRFSS